MERLILISVLIILIGCKPSVEETHISKVDINPDWYNVGFLIMDGVYNTELTAPFDIFQHTRFRKDIKAMNVFLIADKMSQVTTFEGIRLEPDFNYLEDELPKIDILVVPSAEHHMDSDLENENLIDFIKKVDKEALYITSHCDGAFVLAKAGILDNIISTTFPADIPAFKKMFSHLEVMEEVWFVHDGKYITSAGGARSFEAALYLTEILYGDEIARQLAEGLVLDWDLNKVPHFVHSK